MGLGGGKSRAENRKVIKVRGERKSDWRPHLINQSCRATCQSLGYLLLVTEDRIILLTGVSLCVIGWFSNLMEQCVRMWVSVGIPHALRPPAERRSRVQESKALPPPTKHTHTTQPSALINNVQVWKGEGQRKETRS